MVENLLESLRANKHDYKKIFSGAMFCGASDKSDIEPDVNIIIGVKGREDHLKTVVRSFRQNVGFELDYRITVVEIDESPNCLSLCADLSVDYLFIPIQKIGTNGLYSRALAFNTGYFATDRSDYYLFHDCDIIVPSNFLKTLEGSYMTKRLDWLQTFTQKRLRLLTKESTRKIMEEGNFKNISCSLAQSGAAGGSTLVSKFIFERVGGFDSELFFGYSPEDSMFLTKMCAVENKIGPVDSCHQCGPEHYADDPPIELLHLYHLPQENDNPEVTRGRLEILYEFWKYSYEDKMQYINEKQKILQQWNSTLQF